MTTATQTPTAQELATSRQLTALYVPIVEVRIQPTQNANKPAIEKTTRVVSCPVYMVKLFKRQWGHTAAIEQRPIQGQNDLWKVPQMPGMSVVDSEINRLRHYFPKGLFDSVYREDEFYDEFFRVVTDVNKHLVEQEARDDENREAALALASKGMLRAAADAATQAKRGRKPKAIPSPESQTIPSAL